MPERENYFILLGLDPNTTNKQIIENTIANKQNEWSRGTNHPTKGLQYKLYLNYLPNIRKILLDNELIKDEAKTAKKILQTELDNQKQELIKIAKTYIKNNEIFEIDLNEILKLPQFKNFNKVSALNVLNVNLIQGLNTFIKDDNILKFEQSKLTIIKEQLNVLKKIDLFDFLGFNANTQIIALKQKANEIYETASRNANKTAETTAKTELASVCLNDIFKNEESKQRYIKSLDYEKVKELQFEIDTCANIEKIITAENFVNFVINALHKKVSTLDRAEFLIYEYCKLKSYNLKINYKVDYQKPIYCQKCNYFNFPNKENCINCNATFNIKCPKCNKLTNSFIKNCKHCLCDIALFTNYKKLIQQAINEFQKNNFLKVTEIVSTIKWADNKELNTLINNTNNVLNKYKCLKVEIENYINIKNFELADEKISELENLNFNEKEIIDVIIKFKKDILNFKEQSNKEIDFAEIELKKGNITNAETCLNKAVFLWATNPKIETIKNKIINFKKTIIDQNKQVNELLNKAKQLFLKTTFDIKNFETAKYYIEEAKNISPTNPIILDITKNINKIDEILNVFNEKEAFFLNNEYENLLSFSIIDMEKIINQQFIFLYTYFNNQYNQNGFFIDWTEYSLTIKQFILNNFKIINEIKPTFEQFHVIRKEIKNCNYKSIEGNISLLNSVKEWDENLCYKKAELGKINFEKFAKIIELKEKIIAEVREYLVFTKKAELSKLKDEIIKLNDIEKIKENIDKLKLFGEDKCLEILKEVEHFLVREISEFVLIGVELFDDIGFSKIEEKFILINDTIKNYEPKSKQDCPNYKKMIKEDSTFSNNIFFIGFFSFLIIILNCIILFNFSSKLDIYLSVLDTYLLIFPKYVLILMVFYVFLVIILYNDLTYGIIKRNIFVLLLSNSIYLFFLSYCLIGIYLNYSFSLFVEMVLIILSIINFILFSFLIYYLFIKKTKIFKKY